MRQKNDLATANPRRHRFCMDAVSDPLQTPAEEIVQREVFRWPTIENGLTVNEIRQKGFAKNAQIQP